MSSIIAALTAINKASKDRIKYFANFDTMTGVLNRRAGISKLEELFNKSKEYKAAEEVWNRVVEEFQKVNINTML